MDTGSERPAAVKGAPLSAAAERTLDGEDRSETMGKEGKANRISHYLPTTNPEYP